MKTVLTATALLCVLASPALAQSASADAVGVGIANSASRSTAVAVSGQGGAGGNSNATGGNAAARGGNARSSSALTLNSPANTTSTATLNQTVSGRTEQVVSGTTTVRNAPGIVAPGLSAAGLETCLGSASGGISVVGFGLTGGSSTPDPNCNARLDARTLWSIGLKKAAVARLCLSEPIYNSMPEICNEYMPRVQPVGYAVAAPPVRALASLGDPAPYRGGPIMLVEGRTGQERMCNIYNEGKQKCIAWADNSPPKFVRVAATANHKPKPKPAPVRADPVPAPAPMASVKGEETTKKE